MTKLAIMQPYFFPYLGYFGLIKHTDEFVLFDTPQFMRHGWIERNRVLKQNEGWLYAKVPLIKPGGNHETTIKDVRIDNSQPWKRTLLSQLQPYKRIAPYYAPTVDLVSTVINQDIADIVSLNKACLEAVCEYLGIDRPINVFSQMDLQVKPAQAPDEWALHICQALGGVDEYWNPPGGESFFDRGKYDQAGINLRFIKQVLRPYPQKRDPFEAGLSIIDVLMFNSPAEINIMLDEYELS